MITYSSSIFPRVPSLKSKAIIVHTDNYRLVFSGTQNRGKCARTVIFVSYPRLSATCIWELSPTTSPLSPRRVSTGERSLLGGAGRCEKEKGKAEKEKDSLSALVRHRQSLYGRRSSSLHGNIFSYGKMYENLKGQAVC